MPEMHTKDAPELVASPASAIRRLVVPLTAPPYDDEPERPPEEEGNGQSPTRSTAMPPGRDGASRRAPARPGPDAARWPGQFAQALAETLAGSRPSGQLTPWTTEQVRRQIRQLGPLLAGGERPLVRRVMTSAPASGVLELTAVVGFGPRVRVLALRLERDQAGRGWCCTAVESA
jgi:Family of unknown function (DUF6459)